MLKRAHASGRIGSNGRAACLLPRYLVGARGSSETGKEEYAAMRLVIRLAAPINTILSANTVRNLCVGEHISYVRTMRDSSAAQGGHFMLYVMFCFCYSLVLIPLLTSATLAEVRAIIAFMTYVVRKCCSSALPTRYWRYMRPLSVAAHQAAVYLQA